MKKHWIGVVVLVGASMAAGQLLSQMWEQVLGQPHGFSVEAPQVVVNQPAELPKCFVDFAPVSPQTRMITVVDTEAKRIAAYHEDMQTGSLRLLSVRDIREDLLLNQFNPTVPFPSVLMRERQRLEAEKKENR